MCKKLFALCCSVLLLCSMVFCLPASAALSDDDAYRYFDSLRTTIDYYGLDTSASTGEQDIAYFYGVDNSTGNPISCLWIGVTCYRCVYEANLSIPVYNYYSSNKTLSYGLHFVGSPMVAAFYYSASDTQTQLLAGQTNNLQCYNTVANYTNAIDFSELDTLDDLLAAVEPQEPTEPTGSSVDLSGVENGIAGLPGKIGEVFQNIINGLLDGIKTFFTDLFMPDTEAIAEEWEFIQSKFQFWVDVRDFVEEISASLAAMDGSSPEAIEFELKTSGTKWFGGLSGSAVVVDLSWFATYRDSVHVIISAFIWLAYIWRLFHALPGIIAGVQGSAPMDKETARPVSGGAATYDK